MQMWRSLRRGSLLVERESAARDNFAAKLQQLDAELEISRGNTHSPPTEFDGAYDDDEAEESAAPGFRRPLGLRARTRRGRLRGGSAVVVLPGLLGPPAVAD